MTVSNYATATQFRDYIRDPSFEDVATIDICLATASRAVERLTGRHFYQTSSTQYFSPHPARPYCLPLGGADLATTTALVVAADVTLDGTYSDTRTLGTDFICEPASQSVDGIDGWPYTSFRSVNASKSWPRRYTDYQRDTVRVTGTWGWAAVPDPVVQATLVLTAEAFKMMDAPFGYVGFGNFGTARVNINPYAMSLLQPYKKHVGMLVA